MKNNKNVSIELLRVIACFLVIMAHIQLKPVIADGCFSWRRICFSSVIGDNVPIFFLITGFYMFRGIKSDKDIFISYKNKVKSFLIKIWIPALVAAAVTCAIEPWLNGAQTVQWDALQRFIFRNSASGSSGHLWYICTYARFVVFFPFLAFLCEDKPEKNKIRRIYIVAAVFHVLISDAEYLLQKDMIDFSSIVFDRYFLYLLLGNEMRVFCAGRAQDKNWDKRMRIIGLSFYLIGNALKAGFQYYAFSRWGTGVQSWYMGLECFPCYISSSGIFLLFYSMRNADWKLRRVWIFLGKYSFYIYLCHLIVIKKLQSLQVQSYFVNIHCGGTGFVHISLYYLELGLIIFIASLSAGVIFEKIYSLSVKMAGNIFERCSNIQNIKQ